MSEKHILLADPDVKTLEELRQALGQPWSVTAVGTGAAALEELKKHPYDGLIASLCLPDLETGQLLNRVRNKHPKVVRFVVATEKDRERVVKEMLGAHQFLIRPFDASGLRTAVERALVFDLWVDNDKLRQLVARMRTLPTVPALYLDILAALRSSESTTQEVGALIAKDMAIMTKLLQVINSPYFGLPRTITSAEEAVGLLGFDTVKSMVMAVKLLGHYDRIKTGDFSIEQLWQHSTAVAHSARRLVLLQTGNRALAEEAFAAGLLHDVGKAVLAGNFAEQYHGAQSLARKQQIPLWDVEKEIFGANHGEIGAYLLSLWGLPLNILEAAALHHHPLRTAGQGFSALTAVHLANVLEYEATATRPEGEVFPLIDTEYLTEIGVVASLQTWRDELLGPAVTQNQAATDCAESAPATAETELICTPKAPTAIVHAEPAEPSTEPTSHRTEGMTEPVPVCAASEGGEDTGADIGSLADPTTPLPVPRPADLLPRYPQDVNKVNPWLYAAAAALLILLVAGPFIRSHIESKQTPVIIHAHEINSSPTNGLSEPSASAPVQARQLHGEAGELPDLGAQSGVESKAAPVSAQVPEPVATPAAAAAPAQRPTTPKEPQFPLVKLQGILFSPARPSAIINGELVHPNDRISGARVVEINATTVVLEFQDQRRALSLE